MIEAKSEDGLVLVTLDHIGEGWSGDWNEDDPDDEPLLRFDVYEFDNEIGEYLFVDDSSYCTMLSDELPVEVKEKAARYILACVEGDVTSGNSIKKLCERLSWIDTSWLV